MGNNNGACFQSHRGSLPFPCHLQLGTHATINTKTSITSKSGSETGEVSYRVEGSTCKLELVRFADNYGNANILTFILRDSIICSDGKRLSLQIHKYENRFLCMFSPLSVKFKNSIAWTKTKKNVHAWDDVTDTNVYLYGTPNRCGLLVLECEKTDYCSDDCKELTIAHYFVSSNGSVAINRSSQTTDIGFSIVVKVGFCDGKFDISVEGPERHSTYELLCMFQRVNRTGIWKPNIRSENSRMFSQSDSEDNDGVSLLPNLGSQRNATTIANDGRFRGHANGSVIRCRNVWFN